MNALGDRCRSVLVLTDSTHTGASLLDASNGYHVGCVVPVHASITNTIDGTTAPCAETITQLVTSFCSANKVSCAVETAKAEWLQSTVQQKKQNGEHTSAAVHLQTPMTVVDATRFTEAAELLSLLTWLYGESTCTTASPEAAKEIPYTLVAVLDVARGEHQTPGMEKCEANKASEKDIYSWLRPTPSYASEIRESTAADLAHPAYGLQCYIYPVHLYSRQPVVRDRGLHEGKESGDSGAPCVVEWTNKSTLEALLRELAFKAGQLAKYGA